MYERSGNTWIQMGDTIHDDLDNGVDMLFGRSVAMNFDGTVIAAAAVRGNGRLKMLVQMGTTFTDVYNKNLGDLNGLSKWSLYESNRDGNIVAVAARNENNVGVVRVFKWDKGLDFSDSSGSWEILGSFTIAGSQQGEEFGVSISLNESGETIVIGSLFANSNGNNSGRVRVFDLQDDTWVQRGNVLLLLFLE